MPDLDVAQHQGVEQEIAHLRKQHLLQMLAKKVLQRVVLPSCLGQFCRNDREVDIETHFFIMPRHYTLGQHLFQTVFDIKHGSPFVFLVRTLAFEFGVVFEGDAEVEIGDLALQGESSSTA